MGLNDLARIKELNPFFRCGALQGIIVIEMATLQIASNRAAFSPREFAAACGRHPSWCYRLLYKQKIKAVTDLGRILIPASELSRVLDGAEPYNPETKDTADKELAP